MSKSCNFNAKTFFLILLFFLFTLVHHSHASQILIFLITSLSLSFHTFHTTTVLSICSPIVYSLFSKLIILVSCIFKFLLLALFYDNLKHLNNIHPIPWWIWIIHKTFRSRPEQLCCIKLLLLSIPDIIGRFVADPTPKLSVHLILLLALKPQCSILSPEADYPKLSLNPSRHMLP